MIRINGTYKIWGHSSFGPPVPMPIENLVGSYVNNLKFMQFLCMHVHVIL